MGQNKKFRLTRPTLFIMGKSTQTINAFDTSTSTLYGGMDLVQKTTRVNQLPISQLNALENIAMLTKLLRYLSERL